MIAMLALAAILLVRNLYTISMLPDEMRQGQIFRIIFFHVAGGRGGYDRLGGGPGGQRTVSVRRRIFKYDALAVAVTEVGLAFLAVNLVTGSIWARVIWGVWWAWDPRLTSALICWILYAGYLILRQSLEEPTQRATFAAVYSIFAFTDVPIVYFSIRWWRTIHPQPVFFSKERVIPSGLVARTADQYGGDFPVVRRADHDPFAPGADAARDRLSAPHGTRNLDGKDEHAPSHAHSGRRILLQAQPDYDPIRDEIGRLQRNFQGLIWGFVAAWVILLLYTLMLTLRERKIRREMERLKSMVEETGKK